MHELEATFRRQGGWMAGHTVFRSLEHGDGWLEKGALVRVPHLMRATLEAQAERVRRDFPAAELIVGAPSCGAVVAAFVAERLNLPLAISDEGPDGLSFHRMHVPTRGLKTVLVDDLVFSGRDARGHVAFFERFGLEPLGVSAWVSRVGPDTVGAPVSSLMEAPFRTFAAEACPLCQRGEPVVWRGVRE